jgi:ADP-dependent NAD(P)H-hydrate dehydratase / NAD(P)H-hydrate epimerase
MVVTCREMREIEESAFASGVTAAALMDQAGLRIAAVVKQFHPNPGILGLYLGKGNNAGDALVAAKHLFREGWRVWARLSFSIEEFKELPRNHWNDLSEVTPEIERLEPFEMPGLPLVLLDGLVGVGATGSLKGSMSTLALEMNGLRKRSHAWVCAMDIPSGLDGDSGKAEEVCVEADLTITIGHVKRGLLADQAVNQVGRLALVPLPSLVAKIGDCSIESLTSSGLRPLLSPRSFDFHKGMAGRVGLIAGSRGFTGAAALAALGALRGGAGLVTLFVKEDAYPMIASHAPPEAMVKVVRDYREALDIPLDSLAIGPGLGFEWEEEVVDLISRTSVPTVIDADALTMLGRSKCDLLAENRFPKLLTPHPGEMARLTARHTHLKGLDRRHLAESFSEIYPHSVLLLKGARTVITQKGMPTSFNTTGTPAMASGGMGDVLTGLCAALIGQGISIHSAACIGAWTSGRAAELAVSSGLTSEESLLATDVAAHLGAAFNALKKGSY